MRLALTAAAGASPHTGEGRSSEQTANGKSKATWRALLQVLLIIVVILSHSALHRIVCMVNNRSFARMTKQRVQKTHS